MKNDTCLRFLTTFQFYPTALRAIPATVPAVFCVLRFVLWGRNNDPVACENAQRNKQKVNHKSFKNQSKIVQKSIEIVKNRGLEGSRGVLGPQGCPKGARNQKSDEKFAQPPFVPQSLGSPKLSIFDILAIFVYCFVVVFRRRVLEASDHQFDRILG